MSKVEQLQESQLKQYKKVREDVAALLDKETVHPHLSYVQECAATLLEMLPEDLRSNDWRLFSTVMSEIRDSFRIFSNYRDRRKVTVFGSARPKEDSREFQAAVAFGKVIAELGYMVITGGGPGIMHAANLGAGRENSFGLNIEIPWEQLANPVVDGGERSIIYHYFFTRKLFLVRESHALVLFPGGYGTLDEAFETLVLIQAGKSPVKPIVMVDLPHLNYWTKWLRFMQTSQLKNGFISTEDLYLWHITYDVRDAARIVTDFYRIFHSQAWVNDTLLLRLQRQLNSEEMKELNRDFSDILVDGGIEQTGAMKEEQERDGSIPVAELPRLVFNFDKSSYGRLRQLIDRINSFR
jgi:uncharacterized protein (TIGR00730 family)